MRRSAISRVASASPASARARCRGRCWSAPWASIATTPAPDPIHDDAREHLYERTVVEAVRQEGLDVLELPAAPEWLSFDEGTGASYRVTVPVRPRVELGDYTGFPFSPGGRAGHR